MDIILYISIFMMGTVFGSFFTLAVYRIPKKEDITHVRSYCPNCNHKLQFWDMIPILSYLFLGGKCRYCKQKIRIRYLLLEIFSGLVFLLMAIAVKISIESALESYINLAFIYLFMAGMFIVAGIDKEKRKIPNGLIIYEFIIGIVYVILKKYIGMEITSNLIAFVAIPLVLFVIDWAFNKAYKDENKLPFGMGDIKYIAVIGLFGGLGVQIISLILSLVITFVELIFQKDKKDIPFGYYVTIGTIITIIFSNELTLIFESIENIIR